MEVIVPGKAVGVIVAAVQAGWKIAVTTQSTPPRTTITTSDGVRSIEASWNRDGNWHYGVMIRPDRLGPRKLRNAGEVVRILKGENV